MPDQAHTCVCGAPLAEGAIRCDVCNRKALKKLVKWAAAAGALLGLLCSQLPPKYQAPCNMVSKITTLSCGGN